ncbi:TetR-like C-terminal domain-containing protein [Cohnella caldifontis]|uniref:TetR-like C-terminal domain-containing protein n=1 Tax=Cohnella caldifontis TaxID=3027471 RepID=UPI0023EB796C|nr:TetR-like C-terminal domain-containing protein [Cohnella sp. YIM B05605]
MARAGLDQQAVLAAAAEIADTKGVEELTLSTLAQKLGIRPPSLYNHVHGLPGLRRQLVLYAYAKLKETLTQAAVGKAKDEAVRSLAEAYRAYVHRHPGVYEASERYADLTDPEVQRAAGEVVDLLIQVLEPYGLEHEEAIHVIRGFRSMAHGFATIERSGGFGIPLDLDVSYRKLLDAYLAGLRALYAK